MDHDFWRFAKLNGEKKSVTNGGVLETPVISPARGGLSELRHLAQQSAAGRGAQGPAALAWCRGDLWEAPLGLAIHGYEWFTMFIHGYEWWLLMDIMIFIMANNGYELFIMAMQWLFMVAYNLSPRNIQQPPKKTWFSRRFTHT